MSRQEIVLAGFGGQGIILAGHILGQAASVFAGRNATLTQDYGPEARGGACRAQVVVSDDRMSHPYVEDPAVLVAMSQEAYTKYAPGLRQDTLLLIDDDLVKPKRSKKARVLTIPATRIAQELGRTAVANIVMLGFLAAVTGLVPLDALKRSVLASVPKGTEELNMRAFERGHACGVERMKASEGKKTLKNSVFQQPRKGRK